MAQNERLSDIRPEVDASANDLPDPDEPQPTTCPVCNRNLNQFLKICSYEFGLKKPEWDWHARAYKKNSNYMKLENLCSSDYELLRALRKTFPESSPQELIEHARGFRIYHPLHDSGYTREDKIAMKLGNYRRREARKQTSYKPGEIEAFLKNVGKK